MDENKDKACHHHSPVIYQPRHPENTVLYQILQEDLEHGSLKFRKMAGMLLLMWKKISGNISNVVCCATGSPVHAVPVVMNF